MVILTVLAGVCATDCGRVVEPGAADGREGVGETLAARPHHLAGGGNDARVAHKIGARRQGRGAGDHERLKVQTKLQIADKGPVCK